MPATEYLVQNNLDNYGIKGIHYLNPFFNPKHINVIEQINTAI